jgi:excisionase family DNA binding protein
MSRRKRMEITVETSLLVFRRTTNPAAVSCVECSSPVQMITPEEAAVLASVSTRTVYRRVERGQLHFVETDAGRLLICPNCLPTSISAKENNHVTEHIIHHNNHD